MGREVELLYPHLVIISEVFQGERGGTPSPPTFLPGERRPPCQNQTWGERCSPWQGLNMSEVQCTV